jgi:hypothetical protein
MQAAYSRLPLSFEPNIGQVRNAAKFLSHSSNHTLYLESHQVVFEWPTGRTLLPNRNEPRSVVKKATEALSLSIKLIGARFQSDVRGEEALPTKSNYFLGADPAKWQMGIPHYSRVRFRNVYPGIDAVYHGNSQKLEYDFVVSPGGKPEDIAIRFEGMERTKVMHRVAVDSQGDLVLRTSSGVIKQKKAFAYQEVDGIKKEVQSAYVIKGNSEIGFKLGSYDPSKPLVIDPVLSYAVTGIGGSAIAADSQGNAYVVGIASPSFITTSGAFQSSPGGGTCVNGPDAVSCPDILVAKLNSSGTELIYATFLGGSGSEYAYGISVDSAGNVYLTGTTTSTDFPATPGALQTTHSGDSCSTGSCNNAFVTKLNSSGSALLYSTYLHGKGGGLGGNGIAVDSLGCAYLTGDQESGGFVTKLDSTGSEILYTVAGIGGSAIAVDSNQNVYLTGRQGKSSYVSKLTPDAKTIYSFHLGGSIPVYSAAPEEVEALTGIAVDAAGNAYVTGYTAYTDFPTTPGAPFPSAPGAGVCGNSICRDAFVSKVNVNGTGLVYSTYLGGSSIDYANSIALDPAGNAYVTGVTRSSDFPVAASPIASTGGGIFLSKLNAAGTALVYSITLGSGNVLEGGNSLTVDSFSNVYLTGNAGADFPITPESFQPLSGGNGVFVAKLLEDLTLFVPVVLSSAGQDATFFTSELALSNRTSEDITLEFTYTAAFGGGSGRATDTLAANRQRLIPDAVSYLKSLGIPIAGSGNRGGTLSIRFIGVSSSSEGAVTVRTSTAVKNGRVGLAYRGVSGGFAEPVYLCGLRHNGTDRSNVAIQNAGRPSDGDITLRLTVFSGDPMNPGPQATYDEILAPGGFKQISGILQANQLSLSKGFVRVERLLGEAPYYAYAVINDQSSADGSFVSPVSLSSLKGRNRLTLPVIVETSTFNSELVITNLSQATETIRLTFVADAIQASNSMTTIRIILRAQEQLILPSVVDWMRQHGAAGLGDKGRDYVGPLFLSVEQGDVGSIFLGARTSTPSASGGRYGVFYCAVPYGAASSRSTWLYGLQQNDENRTNLGLVNTAELDQQPVEFRLEIYDGDTGLKASTTDGIVVKAGGLVQIGSLLAKYAPGTQQGYLKVTRLKGTNPFVAYTIINDGGQPGERTGDGAYLSSSP